MKIVAFYSHGCQTGKDTAAQFAKERAEKAHARVIKTAFAWEMKLVCARALGIEGTEEEQVRWIDYLKLDGYVKSFSDHQDDDGRTIRNESAIDGRDFIIGLAEGIRALYPEFWIGAAFPSPERWEDTDLYLFTDLRFFGERDAVIQAGGLIVEIVRPGAEIKNEDQITDADYVIVNDGDLDHLRREVDKVMEDIFEGMTTR